MAHAKMNPDGSVDVNGEAYRLVEVAKLRFRVERVRDGNTMGEVALLEASEPGGVSSSPARSRFEIEVAGETVATAEPGAPAVLREVAELLASPGGALPLQ
jgi:hypothetical protein